jgi:hypothetical protein
MKNQELEKFKFVLDYKIIDLCKQIQPREQDIIVLSNRTTVFHTYTGNEGRAEELPEQSHAPGK